MAKKVNSIYIEFEPVTPRIWQQMRGDLQRVIHEYSSGVITWETGMVNVPDRDDGQLDWVPVSHCDT